MAPPGFHSECEEMLPTTAPLTERVGSLPGALLLTAGYYASRLPLVSELIRRLD